MKFSMKEMLPSSGTLEGRDLRSNTALHPGQPALSACVGASVGGIEPAIVFV